MIPPVTIDYQGALRTECHYHRSGAFDLPGRAKGGPGVGYGQSRDPGEFGQVRDEDIHPVEELLGELPSRGWIQAEDAIGQARSRGDSFDGYL